MVTSKPDSPSVAASTPVLEELLAREPLFHRRELVSSRGDFDRETAQDFWEVGASGRRYCREDVWAALAPRYSTGPEDEYVTGDWQITDAELRRVAADAYLLTYELQQGDRRTRRLTVWQGGAGVGWKALYHQGTIVDSD